MSVSVIMELMKLAARVDDLPPEADRIHLANGTLFLDGFRMLSQYYMVIIVLYYVL